MQCLFEPYPKSKDLKDTILDSPGQWERHFNKVIMLQAEVKIDFLLYYQ